VSIGDLSLPFESLSFGISLSASDRFQLLAAGLAFVYWPEDVAMALHVLHTEHRLLAAARL
jgi:hypothetical protein